MVLFVSTQKEMEDRFESIDDFDSINGDFPKDVPNATAVLVLGILSIVTFWIYGIIGIILSIIALGLHTKDRKMYETNKTAYEVSYNSSVTGKICAIIGLVLSGLIFISVVLALIMFAYRW